ncbi:MAG: hypothetical protein V2I36_19880 [Desulfopila sp.]|jgi:predicted nucleic acid-binding protein|nr:hypothetical protein [Desulfopila sp.]
MKRVVADSSAIILLQKTALLDIFRTTYDVVVAPAVYRELTSSPKKGAAELAELLRASVCEPGQGCEKKEMGDGEGETLCLYGEGTGDFVIVDDKKAANACKREAIPFINSLLVPRILHESKVIRRDAFHYYTARLIQEGYYSERIIRRAADLSQEELHPFFPA